MDHLQCKMLAWDLIYYDIRSCNAAASGLSLPGFAWVRSVRYLRIAERHKSYNPCRWVRYVTQSSSYVCRF
ncbi:AP4M [Symbiodinium sp. CCMP2592]|nr:AP4M [Symbiodinium sp. CCMP2592]